VSDLHVAATLPIDYYGQVMDAARDSGPDFLFVTGDFVTRTRHASLLSRVLKPVGKMGSFAILGNHDHWEGPDEVTQVVEGAGFTMLHNRAEAVRLGGGQVLVAGCEDPWATHPWEPPRPNPGDWFVVLTHTADNIYRLNRAGANAVFAGHYHAGQFRVPGLGALVIPSAYGRRFDHGHFVVRGTHLFVSAGVGSAVPPVRIYCAPDLFVVDFKPGATARKEPHAGGGT
jgi:predicted MPP superfamily phosphohydrolase